MDCYNVTGLWEWCRDNVHHDPVSTYQAMFAYLKTLKPEIRDHYMSQGWALLRLRWASQHDFTNWRRDASRTPSASEIRELCREEPD